jgi:predicted RNA-binding Zn-ribbon protein involved in translation (DUF1610 family)
MTELATDTRPSPQLDSSPGLSVRKSKTQNPPNSCPHCGSTKLWRDAKRYTVFGDEIQGGFVENAYTARATATELALQDSAKKLQ